MQRTVSGIDVSVQGGVLRTVSLLNEGYEFITRPDLFCNALGQARLNADVLTFTQSIAESTPIYDYHREWDQLAVLPIQSYENWWKRQINDKTRNMIRKAGKKGVAIRSFQLDEGTTQAIKAIYDECPIRQGKPFKHYDKDLQTLFQSHATFGDRSEFIGAFLDDKLIGFVKLVHQAGWSSMMQIISFISHRDKAPTNALIAKAVEICADRGVPRLQYGIWSRRGIGEFKEHHGFQAYSVPRYYIPLSSLGRIALALGVHKPIRAQVPEKYIDRMISARAAWHELRLKLKPRVASASNLKQEEHS
jgi:hypothetical protein